MARKQARRRKARPERKFELPKLKLRPLLAPLAVIASIAVTYELSLRLLDSEIEAIEVSGPFQRVTALAIEEAIADELAPGFLRADLSRIQTAVQALPWIDQAAVARRWPSRIVIRVTEQVPAAVWGDTGLLNVRGELFVEDATHLPAELPRLSGPDDRHADVAEQYLDVRDRLIPMGLDLRTVHLDARGAWQMTLANGVEVRMGRRDVERRTDLFVDVAADVVAGRAQDIDYVDMRYSNGFTVGWKGGAAKPGDAEEPANPAMLASRSDR
ncbi:MAG: cell division protein FtsQ/DivIB [Pseudomonadota bacterium]